MPLSTLLLDAGGTIVFPNFRRIADEFAKDGVVVAAGALAHADARVRLHIDNPDIIRRIATENDETRWFRYIENLLRYCGAADVPAAVVTRLKQYHDAQNLWEDVPADVVPALESLRSRFRLGVVSNANGTVRAKLERLGLARFFETVVDSHEEEVEKPDPRIFRVALRRMRVRPEEAAYLGDLYHVDVIGARAAGLTAFLLDPLGLHTDKPCPRVASLADLMRVSV